MGTMKRIKRSFMVGVVVLAASLIGVRIWWVNAYPDPQFLPPEEKIYQIGEWVPLEGNFQFTADECTEGYYVKVEDIQFCTPEEYAAQYGLDISLFQMGINGELPEYVADVTLNFRNEGTDEGYIQFLYYRIYTQQDFSCFYPLPEVNLSLHPEMGDKLGFKIYPGTESGPTRFCLGTEIEINWPVTGNLDIFPKYLQVSLTPERKLIEILELD